MLMAEFEGTVKVDSVDVCFGKKDFNYVSQTQIDTVLSLLMLCVTLTTLP